MTEKKEPLYKRCRLRQEDIRARLFAELYDHAKSTKPEAQGIYLYKMGLVHDQSQAALRYYLEGDLSQSVARAADVVLLGEDYFFGSWRREIPDKHGNVYPEEHWLTLPWVKQYRWAMFWASSLGNWDAAVHLSQYPSELTVDEVSERKAEAPWYQRLAAYCRGDRRVRGLVGASSNSSEFSGKEGSYEEVIEQGRSKRLKLLNAVLASIADAEAGGVEDSLNRYFAYYRKNESPRDVIDDKIAVDGSILVNLAKRSGIPVVVPEPFTDHVITFPTT